MLTGRPALKEGQVYHVFYHCHRYVKVVKVIGKYAKLHDVSFTRDLGIIRQSDVKWLNREERLE